MAKIDALQQMIQEMGYGFRDLTYHSSGQYSTRLGFSWYRWLRGRRKEFWGNSPLEAVRLAHAAHRQIEWERGAEK